MKPSNPMQQLAEWKAKHGKQTQNSEVGKQAVEDTPKNASIQAMTALKQEGNANPQGEGKIAQKLNQRDFIRYMQTTRQFDLMKSAVERCKRDYPDCFHHKQQQAIESRQIALNLRQGLKVWEKLAQGEPLTAQMSRQLHHFKQTVNYLAFHFDDVAKFIDKVETAPLT